MKKHLYVLTVFLAFAVQASIIDDDVRDKCIKEHKVPQETLDELRNLKHVNDPKLIEACICFVKNSNLVTDDGQINLDKLKSRVTEQTKCGKTANTVVNKCYKEKETLGKTCDHLLFCLRENGIAPIS